MVCLTSRVLTVEVWVESLGAHLAHFVHIVLPHILQEPPQVGPGVERPQSLLLQVQHLVHSSLVFQLEVITDNVSPCFMCCSTGFGSGQQILKILLLTSR